MKIINYQLPTINSSPIFHSSNRAEWPTDWDTVFGRKSPFVIEIGFGNGRFITELARKRPSANILGIEIANPSLVRGARKLRAAQVNNVRLTQADAKYILWALCRPQTISELYINFPDPWRREKHYHRRLISDQFLELAASRMIAGGQLNIATDHADYAQWINERLERTPYFHSRRSTTFVTGDAYRINTKYEQQAVDVGRICHYYHWERGERETTSSFASPQEFHMPHAIIQTPLSPPQIGERFTEKIETAVADQDIRATFLDAYHSYRYDSLLVETFVHDPLVQQHIAFAVRQRDDGSCVVKLHDIGFPRPTLGVKFAVGQLTKWILSLHPDGKLIHSNLG